MSFGFLYYLGLSLVAAALSIYIGFFTALVMTILLALAPALALRLQRGGDKPPLGNDDDAARPPN